MGQGQKTTWTEFDLIFCSFPVSVPQPRAVQGSLFFFVAFATCPVRSSAVLGNSKATSQAPQIITAPAQGSKLSKKMKANAPIKRSWALMQGITVKVIFYGQMLMTGSRMPDGGIDGRTDARTYGRGVNTCDPCKHSHTTGSL